MKITDLPNLDVDKDYADIDDVLKNINLLYGKDNNNSDNNSNSDNNRNSDNSDNSDNNNNNALLDDIKSFINTLNNKVDNLSNAIARGAINSGNKYSSVNEEIDEHLKNLFKEDDE